MKIIMILSVLFIGTSMITASAQTTAEQDSVQITVADRSAVQNADRGRATIRNTFGFGPKIGYYKAQDADEGKLYGGLQARLRLGSVVGLEASVEYRPGQEYGIGNQTVTTNFIPLTGSLLLFVPVNQYFTPYAVAGIGAYYTSYDVSGIASEIGFDDDSTFNVGYHLGFGTEIPITSSIALSADYRYLFLNTDNNEESFDGADFNGNIISAGLMFYF